MVLLCFPAASPLLPRCFPAQKCTSEKLKAEEEADLPKLTKRVVDAIRPDPEGHRDVFIWDSELRGFGVRMKPSGAAS